MTATSEQRARVANALDALSLVRARLGLPADAVADAVARASAPPSDGIAEFKPDALPRLQLRRSADVHTISTVVLPGLQRALVRASLTTNNAALALSASLHHTISALLGARCPSQMPPTPVSASSFASQAAPAARSDAQLTLLQHLHATRQDWLVRFVQVQHMSLILGATLAAASEAVNEPQRQVWRACMRELGAEAALRTYLEEEGSADVFAALDQKENELAPTQTHNGATATATAVAPSVLYRTLLWQAPLLLLLCAEAPQLLRLVGAVVQASGLCALTGDS
eukprot:1913237-Pleurochrysis_carterae.AAC.1